MLKNEKKLYGVYLEHKEATRINLLALSSGKSKSEVLRDSLTMLLARTPANPILINKLADQLQQNWNKKKKEDKYANWMLFTSTIKNELEKKDLGSFYFSLIEKIKK